MTSVLSVAGMMPGYYKCGYQGHVTTTSSDSLVSAVYVYINGVQDNFAFYVQKRQGEPLIWDYNGTSMAEKAIGTSHSVKTRATVYSLQNGQEYVWSGTLTWLSGT